MPELSARLLRRAAGRGAAYLKRLQQVDGGWCREKKAKPDAWTTAEGVIALHAVGNQEFGEDIDKAVNWLRGHQARDGSWTSEAYRRRTKGTGDVAATSYALRALAISEDIADFPRIIAGRDWLVARQRKDGGWGISSPAEGRSHVGLTAYAIRALAYSPAEHDPAEAIQSGLYYLYKAKGNNIGWCFAPSQGVDPTLTGYALRALIDAFALKGYRPRPEIFIAWLRGIQSIQRSDGSWSDWYGSTNSTEATSYCLEIVSSLGKPSLTALKQERWLESALRFILDSQRSSGGWARTPADDESPWVSYSVMVALTKVLNRAGKVSLSLTEAVFPNIWKRRSVAPKVSGNYDFAISFAGPDRPYAYALALRLQQQGATVFYDEFEASALWGANLVDRLVDVYRDKARFCLMLISAAYIKRAWPKLERQSAQARAFKDQLEYILPIILEEGVRVPGLLETVGYLKSSEYDIESIASLAIQKLSQS